MIITQPDADQTPCWTAFLSCGHWIATAVDTPDRAKENAKEVGAWIRKGFRVEKVPVCDIRSGKVELCNCKPRPKL